MSDLELAGVSVAYGDRPVVTGVDLTVAAGQTVAVLGPSGCGKSTLLRAIAGIEPLIAGRICLAGTDLAGVPTYRRGIGLMFQEAALFEHLDVFGNVAFGLRMQRQPRSAIGDRVTQMLTLVGLAEHGSSPVAELSGGERQRVALARTLAPAPGVVLLDEPLGALDQALRRELIGVLADAFTATGATVVQVTHDQAEAFALADRVAVMRDGRVVRVDSPAAIMADPGDEWVADFLR